MKGKPNPLLWRLSMVLTLSAGFFLVMALPTTSGAQTATQTPTRSPTPTITANFTRTEWAARLTGTAQAVGATRTQQALRRAELDQALSATRTQLAVFRTETAAAREATATFIAEHTRISRQELINNADRYAGQKIRLLGRVSNIIDAQTLQLWVDGRPDAEVIVVSKGPLSDLNENDIVIVYGTVLGFLESKNALGVIFRQPAVIDAVLIGPRR